MVKVSASVTLAAGLCQPITPLLFGVCVWVGCVFRSYWLFLGRRDPHYCPHTVTSICFPPSFFFSSWHALQLAPNVPCAGPTRSKEGGKDCKNKNRKHIKYEKESTNLRTEEVGTHRRVRAVGFSRLFAGKTDLWSGLGFAVFGQRLVCDPASAPAQQDRHPRRPCPRERQLLQWCIARPSVQRLGKEEGQGLKPEKVCVRGEEREIEREKEGIMSVSKLAWLTQRKTAVCVTNDLFQ